jgi:HSP20 family molecular chaperone IbpA
MSTLFFEKSFSPFDLLFKDFYKSDLNFQPAIEARISHPIDIYEDSNGLYFEIACTGLTKEDVEVNIEGDILKISYVKGDEPTRSYIHKGIAKRSFNLGYKISSKFNLSKAEAKMNNGLLGIVVPFAEEAKPKALKIS